MKKIKIFACLLAFICFLPLPVLAFEPSGYVTDQANVIDQAVEDQIMTLNNQLEAKNGGQIFVVTVDFLDGQAIDDYAYHLFNDWGIGSAEYNNGVLLLLAIGEENYYCLQGSGLEYDLSSSSIKRILNDYLEDDFASGNYSDGVMKTVEALYEIVYATEGTPMYNDNPNNEYYPNYYPDEYYPNDYYYPDRSFSFFSGIFNLIFFFIIFAIIFSSIFAPRRRRGYYSRRPFIFFGSPHHHHHHYGPRPPFGGGSHFHGGGFHGGGGGSSHGGGFHGGGGGGSRGGGAGR